jgi:hypothetical protein
VGTVLGPPAPVFWTWGHEQESALARLHDVVRVIDPGQVLRDFVEAGRGLRKGDAEILADGRSSEQAVVWTAQRGKSAAAYAGTSQRGVR